MMNMDVMSAHSETDDPNGEGEGVWSPEIEQAFQEALKLFPPCGRRKHILQEEGGGKMYGRNELIARYIEQKTGHKRTRKQVSSHIQVLSRREARSKASSRGDTESVSPASSITASSNGGTERVLSRPESATSAYNNNNNNNNNGITLMELSNGHHINHHHSHHNHHHRTANHNHHHHSQLNQISAAINLNPYFWEDRPIVTRKIRLVEFSAFIEQRKLNDSDQLSAVAAAATATNGNGVGGNNQAQPTLSQAAVLASLAAASGANEFDQSTTTATAAVAAAAAAAAAAAGNSHLQMPQFAATYAGGITSPYQMDSNNNNTAPPNATNPNLSAQFTSAAAHSAHQQQQQHASNGNHLPQHNSYYNQITSSHHNHASLNGTNLDPYASLDLQQLATPLGFHRHSYVKIDYRQLSERQPNKTEGIDIRVIQDKFPDIGGPGGLYQRGSPDSFFLVKFWADSDNDSEYGLFEDQNSYFGFSSQFETIVPYKDITCSTKACSYGKQVVEKVDKVYGAFNSSNNTYSYVINRSPMCEFMISFIKKLRQYPDLETMNKILENFTVLQLVTSDSSQEILMCIAYVFEIAPKAQEGIRTSRGSHYHVYRLTKGDGL